MNMEKKENSQGRGLKLYETFTVEREVNFSTGANCYLSRLEGGLILLDEDVIKPESGLMGAPGKKVFVFKAVFPGLAAYQLAHTHVSESDILYEQVLPVEIKEDNVDRLTAGGWSDQHDLSPEEVVVFRKAMEGLCGVMYEPLSVATQIVEGVNYRYICKSTTVTNPPRESHAMVYIHQALPCYGGEVMITKIVPFLND